MTDGDDAADVVVVGLGPGGESSATGLAGAGLAVVGIDQHLVGGECPYYGCVPTKMMIRAADLLAESRRAPGMAGEATTTAQWQPVAARIAEEATDHWEATDDWDDRVAVERLERGGVRFMRGHARLAGPGRVAVEGWLLTTRRGVLLDTGTEPAVPAIEGLADTPYWTNRDAVRLTRLPDSLVVLGGGGVGAEFAQAFARFGVTVSVVEAAARLLGAEEPEASSLIAGVFAREGITVRTEAAVRNVHHDSRADFRLGLADGTEVGAEALLVATGRRANLTDIGLDTIGLPGRHRLDTDTRLRVVRDGRPVDNLWAIGDVTGQGAFTHMSMYQAQIAMRDILGRSGPGADYRAVPRVTFTDPEVGAVGMTERQAGDAGLSVRTGTASLPGSARGWIHKAGNDGLVKLVEDAERQVLVGATSIGPAGGEVLSILALAVHAQVPTGTLRSMIYAYPTFHRAVEDALGDLS